MDDYKKRVQDALNKHALSQMPKTPKSGRRNKNQSPEKLVQNECLHWLRLQGFAVHVIDSKATYSLSSQTYRSSTVKPGFSDLVGCDNNGIFLAIELKAKGKLSTLKPHQRQFLEEKIKRGAFAVCVDSVDLLKTLYRNWNLVTGEPAKLYLLHSLPPKKESSLDPLFEG